MRKPVIESDFTYKGYKCSVIFQTLCHRCGYVAVPAGHSLYAKDYNELPIACHGGLTYDGPSLFGHEDESYIWWIGFDCSHYADAKDYQTGRKYFGDDPASIVMLDRWEYLDKYYPCYGEVRTQEYVEEQCRSIVDQLIKYDRPWNKCKRWIRERLQDILYTVRRFFRWGN